jgi:hypothetical protein
MGSDTQQFKATEDDCVYFFDNKRKHYRKICDIQSFSDLPLSVKRQIKAAKKEAADIIQLPTE